MPLWRGAGRGAKRASDPGMGVVRVGGVRSGSVPEPDARRARAEGRKRIRRGREAGRVGALGGATTGTSCMGGTEAGGMASGRRTGRRITSRGGVRERGEAAGGGTRIEAYRRGGTLGGGSVMSPRRNTQGSTSLSAGGRGRGLFPAEGGGGGTSGLGKRGSPRVARRLTSARKHRSTTQPTVEYSSQV